MSCFGTSDAKMVSVSTAWILEYLQPGRSLVDVGTNVLSAVEADTSGSIYDRHARTYDRLISNRLYNRLVWRASPTSYTAFAAAAVADSDGPMLDVGCGTAVFTAECYRSTDRPVILVDRSLGMLARAAKRLVDADTDRIALVQADLFDLPFRLGAFTTVSCHGLLHLFEDPGQVLEVLRSQVAPGGSLYATSLLAETRIGAQALRLLYRGEEAAVPRRENDLATLARAALGDTVDLRREGAMAFLRCR